MTGSKSPANDQGYSRGVDMGRDFAGFEQAAIWLHVVIAVVLPGYLICGKDPAVDEWITPGQQTLNTELSSDSLLPESTPQPAGTSAARPPPGYVTVTDASFSASTTSRKEGS